MIELIGYTASIASVVCYFPQLLKILRTKQVRDISIWWGILLMFANICWLVYGIANSLLPVILCNAAILAQASLLVALKIRHSV